MEALGIVRADHEDKSRIGQRWRSGHSAAGGYSKVQFGKDTG
jgi:hypothetical protein